MARFAFVPREQNEPTPTLSETNQNTSIVRENKENKPLDSQSQARADYEKSQSLYSQKLAKSVNVQSLNFDDDDLNIDLDD